MRTFKKILKYTGLALLVLLLSLWMYVYASGPTIPKEANQIIDSVIQTELPEIIKGKTGFAENDGVKTWYEIVSPGKEPKGTVLLVMGISADGLGWPQSFINGFLQNGYNVIRYDHRGTGLSDWKSPKPYSLKDMSDDAIAILDANNIEKANIVGVSMGGMIAQEIAINNPDRVQTLTSIMSSGYAEDPDLPGISATIAFQLIRAGLKYGLFSSEKSLIKMNIAIRMILRGNAHYDLNIKEIATSTLYNLRKRKGFNFNVSGQHQTAVKLSGSRYEKLKRMTVPTLIIHGESDPFIPIAHSRKMAEIIPGANSVWIKNLAHDIPENMSEILVDLINSHIIENTK